MQKTINNKIIKITAQNASNFYANNIYKISVQRKNSNIKQTIIIHNIQHLQNAIKNNCFVTTNNVQAITTQQHAQNYFTNTVLISYTLYKNNNIVQRYTQHAHYNVIAKIALKYLKLFNIL